jgi:undecaprenyl-diphosphatase
MLQLVEAIGRLDFAAFQWLRAHHWPWLDPVMTGLSDIAISGAIWMFLALLIGLVHRSRWTAVIQVLLAVVITGLVTDYVAKPYFNRQRPFETYAETRVYGYKPTTRSLPSGHASGAIAGAYTLSRLAPESRVIFWVLAVLVAFSRVYLGVHYPIDVLAGVLLGFGIAKFVVGGTRWRFPAQAAQLRDDR